MGEIKGLGKGLRDEKVWKKGLKEKKGLEENSISEFERLKSFSAETPAKSKIVVMLRRWSIAIEPKTSIRRTKRMFINIDSIDFNATVETLIKHGNVFVNEWPNEAFTILEHMVQNEGYSVLMVEQDNHQHQVAIFLTNNDFPQWKMYYEKEIVIVYNF